MIKSFYDAGKVLSQLNDYKDYFRPWANPFPKLRGEAKVIIAEINDDALEPALTIEDFRSATAYIDKYLFREAKANATNLVPTFYVQAQADADKQADSIRKMIKKVRQSVTNYKHTFVTSAQIDAIEGLLQGVSFDPKTTYLFTMRIDGLYFGDVQANRDLFISDAYQKYSSGSSATDKVCAVTYEASPEVWGRVDTLGFAVTDVAFARNGFNTAESYKMFPVSPEVVKTLEGAKRVILDKLSRNFFEMKYFVMPHFLQHISDESAAALWNEFLLTCSTDSTVMSEQFGPLVQNENTIGAILESQTLSRESVYYDIFFYQPNKAQFMIKLHVSDVLPSRFRHIMETKTKVDRAYLRMVDTVSTFVKGQFEPFTVTLATVKEYFTKKILGKGVTHPYFFRVVEAVFYQQQLDREQLLRAFLDIIRISFKNSGKQPYQFSQDVRHTFVLLQFFYQLKLLSFSDMEPTDPQPVGLTLKIFEQQHLDLFDNPLRKAAFRLGVQVETLLYKQKRHYKGSTIPFYKNLNGLTVDVIQLQRIKVKLDEKVREYAQIASPDARHYSETELNHMAELDRDIYPILEEAKIANTDLYKKYSLLRDDISYAFAMGLAMERVFRNEFFRFRELKKANQTSTQTGRDTAETN